MPSSPGSVGLARAHPLTKTQAMEPFRQTWSSYGPPYPLGRWSLVCALCAVCCAVCCVLCAVRCVLLCCDAVRRVLCAVRCVPFCRAWHSSSLLPLPVCMVRRTNERTLPASEGRYQRSERARMFFCVSNAVYLSVHRINTPGVVLYDRSATPVSCFILQL